jgi:hypothetical protein
MFYYLCKSIDSVNREILWHKLRVKGVNDILTNCDNVSPQYPLDRRLGGLQSWSG